MPLTLDEVNEALAHATAVPMNDRGDAWCAYVDSLLEQRMALAGTAARFRDTRVLTVPETR